MQLNCLVGEKGISMITKDVELGKGVKIYHRNTVNLYGCKIGAGSVVGAFVEIGKNVVIGKRVKIQAFAYIPEGVTIEDEVIISPHACFINDKYPRSTNPDGTIQKKKDWQVIPTKVCKKASIGANATILCGVTVGEGALVGAGSVVTRDVPPWTIVAGNPARVIRKIKK